MALPDSLSLVQITGPIVDDQGNPLSGTLELTSSINRVLNVNGLVVPVFRRIAVVNGAFSYSLLPSSAVSLSNGRWTWHARFISNDQTMSVEFDLLVPNSGPATLGSIVTAPDNTSSVVFSGSTSGSSTARGTQGHFGIPTTGTNGTLVVPFTSNWGINTNGSAYYSATGATAGEAAYLSVGSSGALTLVKPQGTAGT